MAALESQVISTTYSNYSVPTGAFTTVNLTPHTNEGVVSYDNAELIEAMSTVYHLAQQEVSILSPLIPNKKDIKAMFNTKDTFGKIQMVEKVEETPYTPLTTVSGATRAYSATILHQSVLLDRDVHSGSLRRYPLLPEVQAEITAAMARAEDIAILSCLTGSVLNYATASSKDFQGIRTASTVAFPRSQIYVHGKKTAANKITYNKLTTALFDDIVNLYEDRSIDASALLVIAPPRARRQLKDIIDFRNVEKTNHFSGNENARTFMWNGLRFVFMGPETLPKTDVVVGQKVGEQEGVLKAVAGNADVAIDANDDIISFLVVDLSGFIWGHANYAKETLMDVESSRSFGLRFYWKTGFGGLRIDDLKVLNVIAAR